MTDPGTNHGGVDSASGSLRRILAAHERERRRLARELHDEIGQSLTSILLGLRSLEAAFEGSGNEQPALATLGSLRELTATTIQDVRRLSVELRPKTLDDYGLVAALERLVAGWQEATGIVVTFTANIDAGLLSNELATGLYRIVEEVLTNIVKHAEARHVSIVLTRKDESVVTIIEDDGQGFDPASPAPGFGLEHVRERLALLDGRLQIESSAEAGSSGTTIVIEAPLF